MARPRVRVCLAAPLLAVALAGCAQSDDRATVQATTERFLRAHGADQGAIACAALSSDTREALESQEGRPCPQAIGSVELGGGPVVQVDVTVTSAKVDLAGGESVFLSEQASGWRISALGCRSAGAPTDMPFDCELEA